MQAFSCLFRIYPHFSPLSPIIFEKSWRSILICHTHSNKFSRASKIIIVPSLNVCHSCPKPCMYSRTHLQTLPHLNRKPVSKKTQSSMIAMVPLQWLWKVLAPNILCIYCRRAGTLCRGGHISIGTAAWRQSVPGCKQEDPQNLSVNLPAISNNALWLVRRQLTTGFNVNYACLQSLGLLVGNTYKIHLKVTDGGGLSNVANSTLTIIPTPALQVIVDIKPGSCPNPLNVKSSGVLPAAILGTADFDVTTIDATSIRLAGVSPLRSSIEDVAGPAIDSNDCNCTEDGPDGLADLTLKFKTRDIVEAIGDCLLGDTVNLKLTGVLIGERPIEGADCVVIGGKSKPFNKADVNKDGVVDSQDFAEFAQSWLQSTIVDD
jgi:hypothetical protein